MINNLFEKINIESRNSKFLYDGQKNQEIVVDNSFQRKYVWTLKHQVKLIETILMGFPIPEIYLWQRNTNPETGETQFAIVDGQQRLGALTDFINNEFALMRVNLDADNKDIFGGKYFKDLDQDLKARLWKYNFSVRFIDDVVDRETIVKLFLKLNSTEFTLNPQELRNAQFDGLFLQLAEEIAGFEFWSENKIFKDTDIRRMKDIQIISTLLIFLRKGIEEEYTQKNINQTYDLYNREYDERDEDKAIFLNILNVINEIINYSGENNNVLRDIIKVKTHFYSIFTLVYFLVKSESYTDIGRISNLLVDWFKSYQENDFSRFNGLAQYRDANQEATQSKASRLKRFEKLKEYIELNY
ncbi:DUF262 domain-containing protein [Acinetobacter bereziniae]|uniref:DUF262 domain-containing protein n=1 Tax=Acinetobacter bereziniae TaxID=106648 RepID=UPI00300A2885